MDRPDVHEMAARAERLYDELAGFQRELEEAQNAAEGEWDEEGNAIVPNTANGDDVDLFEGAQKDAAAAMSCMTAVRRALAAQHGLREFERDAVS